MVLARHFSKVGFSNGANIAASLLLTYPRLLAGAILLRAMVLFEPDKVLDLSGTPVYLAAGRSDQMVPPENTERLAQVLGETGADVTLDWQPGEHGIGSDEIQAARDRSGHSMYNESSPGRQSGPSQEASTPYTTSSISSRPTSAVLWASRTFGIGTPSLTIITLPL